ncbi:tumor necrosis factor receptor superfamily member 13B isoform X1 [Hippoglossus stenolepis]|uniref:tumor necrosis factor receptor superfamily member 13B isoform X1 n=1 Tax=Hippoglossus stenolepis TaxID=195615 RepID=UPI00159C0CA2|nr:tumor necrosis factor receptor superfamily member 13B isoform X1 [Hippoglossus stenolepis]
MGGSCPEGQYRDGLVKECLSCRLVCQQPPVISRCITFCDSTHCKGLPGHYYDALLKRCMRCAEVCGKHPAECSQHCHTTPPPVTTKMLVVKVSPHLTNSRGLSVPMALEDPTLLLYSLLALCMVLLFSSLSLALAVLLRRSRAKSSKPKPKEAKQKLAVQPGEKLIMREGQLGHTSKNFVTSPGCPPNREQSDDSIPTETCVCVHCFPDLKALGQSNDKPLGPPFSFNQQAGFPVAQTMNGRPLWTEQSHHEPGGGSSEIRFLCSPSN